MKRNILSVAFICFTFAFFSVVTNSYAQRRSTTPVKYMATFESKMKLYEIDSPDYKEGSDLEGNSKELKTKWQVLRLEYEMESTSRDKDHWAEDVEFEWNILILRDKSVGKPILIKKTVSYLETPAGEKGLATSLFIRPQVIERYFDGKKVKESDISIKMIVRVKGEKIKVKTGKIMAEAYFYGGKRQSEKVWSYEAPLVAKITNPSKLFLNKAETPFAALETQSFQVIKQSETK